MTIDERRALWNEFIRRVFPDAVPCWETDVLLTFVASAFGAWANASAGLIEETEEDVALMRAILGDIEESVEGIITG